VGVGKDYLDSIYRAGWPDDGDGDGWLSGQDEEITRCIAVGVVVAAVGVAGEQNSRHGLGNTPARPGTERLGFG
jgi:hypothetical protein